jgi:hypothetical protein
MIRNLPTYPSTKRGVKDLVQDLTPTITNLWKSERGDDSSGDDLVVVVDLSGNRIFLKPRSAVYSHLKRSNPDIDLLKHLAKPASSANGTVKIWAIIGWSNGKVCALPFVVARS